ncbi:DUF1360 domain-containing protein [Paenibacillus alvei]|uniref:DUF1360 domain-containing protein n=1 Tax=Paenibacillus alvei TaxID=44250 RepID=A0AAP7DHA7_PAEAL|nr:DUF1360 domain-containing protein [Paenibacillus alvei]MBG9736800.1 sporulation protein [Paenibacillus alvei]MBG9746956.1 sporulation protein [Paenibacillus alvei]MCY9581983.1 DUF1360 domain-containing protein [Paenibacillus alvei]MCY9585881.1 DUF1360 domain-containing protein [Paenibacillus alvei]NEZ43548.1 DUF1360 domain-containing protein [Paenibacillus alvei]
MQDITWLSFILLILASYRLTRLIVFDEITSFIRKPFVEERFHTDENGTIFAVIDEKGGRFHAFMRKLLTCYWCTGVWSAALVTVCYLLIPTHAFPVILLLAIAGAAGIVESFVKG